MLRPVALGRIAESGERRGDYDMLYGRSILFDLLQDTFSALDSRVQKFLLWVRASINGRE